MNRVYDLKVSKGLEFFWSHPHLVYIFFHWFAIIVSSSRYHLSLRSLWINPTYTLPESGLAATMVTWLHLPLRMWVLGTWPGYSPPLGGKAPSRGALLRGAWWLTQLHTAVSGGYYLFIGGDGDGLAGSRQRLLFPFLSTWADSWLLSRMGAHAPHLPTAAGSSVLPSLTLYNCIKLHLSRYHLSSRSLWINPTYTLPESGLAATMVTWLHVPLSMWVLGTWPGYSPPLEGKAPVSRASRVQGGGAYRPTYPPRWYDKIKYGNSLEWRAIMCAW